jgi:hypothetical protein
MGNGKGKARNPEPQHAQPQMNQEQMSAAAKLKINNKITEFNMKIARLKNEEQKAMA